MRKRQEGGCVLPFPHLAEMGVNAEKAGRGPLTPISAFGENQEKSTKTKFLCAVFCCSALSSVLFCYFRSSV